LLKRCKYIVATMAEVKLLRSDLGSDTVNRIYALRTERDEALARIATLERENKELVARLKMK
jgi:hypothetical protein